MASKKSVTIDLRPKQILPSKQIFYKATTPSKSILKVPSEKYYKRFHEVESPAKFDVLIKKFENLTIDK